MRRPRLFSALTLALGFSLLGGVASAGNWDELYAARLGASSDYLEARLSLKTAEVAYAQYTQPYVPTIGLATSTSNALSLDSGGFSAGYITPSVTFENIWGADVALKAPLTPTSSGGLGFGSPSLSVTRKIFVETSADRLDAEAGVMAAKAAIKKAEMAVRIALATEVLNANYYGRLLRANQENLDTLEKVRTATVDETYVRELDKRILQARRAILVASNALADIHDDVKADAETLDDDVMRMQAEWTRAVNAAEPKTSLSIDALELSLEAAVKRSAFPLLPYLPNPSVTASLYYDVDKKAMDWGLSLSMSYQAFNKGANALATLKRREIPKVLEIRLADARKNLSDGARKTRSSIELLQLDKKIQELQIADAQDNAATMEKLYAGGYTSRENLLIARIDLTVENIIAQKIDYDILIQTLNLANYYDAE